MKRSRKPKLDEVRTLAFQLFNASQKEKLKHPEWVWGSGRNTTWENLPIESVAVWDAVAIEALKQLRK